MVHYHYVNIFADHKRKSCCIVAVRGDAKKKPQSKQVFFQLFLNYNSLELYKPRIGYLKTETYGLKKLLTKSEAQLHYAMAVSKTTMDSYYQKL